MLVWSQKMSQLKFIITYVQNNIMCKNQIKIIKINVCILFLFLAHINIQFGVLPCRYLSKYLLTDATSDVGVTCADVGQQIFAQIANICLEIANICLDTKYLLRQQIFASQHWHRQPRRRRRHRITNICLDSKCLLRVSKYLVRGFEICLDTPNICIEITTG